MESGKILGGNERIIIMYCRKMAIRAMRELRVMEKYHAAFVK